MAKRTYRNSVHAKEFRLDEVKILKKFNRTTYLVKNMFIYHKRYVRGNVTTWECCSHSMCGARLLSRHNAFFKESGSHISVCNGNKFKVQQKEFKSFVYTLCTDKTTLRSNSDIYNVAATMYPDVAVSIPKQKIERSIMRWKNCLGKIPMNLKKLEMQMNDAEVYRIYGRNTFSNFGENDAGYRFFDKLTEVECINDNGIRFISKILSFKGKEVHLAGDGSEKLCPKDPLYLVTNFDNVCQLYVVHGITHKKVSLFSEPFTFLRAQ